MRFMKCAVRFGDTLIIARGKIGRMSDMIKEQDIRPEAVRQEYWSLLEAKVRSYLDSEGRMKSENVEHVDCPVCGSARSREMFTKRGFRFVQCLNCELQYVNPTLKDELILEFYNSEAMNFMQNVLLKSAAEVRKNRIHIPRARWLHQIAPSCSHPILLEIGCSVGYFLEAAKEVDAWSLFAVEPNEDSARRVRKELGVEVYDSLLNNADLESQVFDVVVGWEVIEHIKNPKEIVSHCWKILNDQGVLVMSTPNVCGFDFEILGPQNRSYSPPGHLIYFNPESLTRLLRESGFARVEITTPGVLDVDNVRNEVLRAQYEVSLPRFLEKILLENTDEAAQAREFLQKSIVLSNMSSHMVAIAWK